MRQPVGSGTVHMIAHNLVKTCCSTQDIFPTDKAMRSICCPCHKLPQDKHSLWGAPCRWQGNTSIHQLREAEVAGLCISATPCSMYQQVTRPSADHIQDSGCETDTCLWRAWRVQGGDSSTSSTSQSLMWRLRSWIEDIKTQGHHAAAFPSKE